MLMDCQNHLPYSKVSLETPQSPFNLVKNLYFNRCGKYSLPEGRVFKEIAAAAEQRFPLKCVFSGSAAVFSSAAAQPWQPFQ